MPELPEVETVVRELRPELVGRRIRAITVSAQRLRRAWSTQWKDRLAGRRISAVRRRGKWIIVELDRDLHLLLHLGMTGQLTIKRASEPVTTHTHLIADLGRRGMQLRFRDVRRFGSATLFDDSEALERFFTDTQLGPEPFDLGQNYWLRCLAATKRCLKAVLLDQRVIAGIGNIYADEALFQARLHPARVASQLNSSEASRLRRAIIQVLNRAISRRGSSIRDYVGGNGVKGGYQREFRVYGRTGRPCRRCRTAIEQMRLAGRSTHFCPSCQALPKKV